MSIMFKYFRDEKIALKELKSEATGGCLVPNKNARNHFITDHSKEFCSCDILFLLDKVEALEGKLEKIETRLGFAGIVLL